MSTRRHDVVRSPLRAIPTTVLLWLGTAAMVWGAVALLGLEAAA